MVDALLNVKFLLVREHQIGQHAIFHEVQKVSTSFDPHSFMCGCELMALLHLVGEGLEVLLKDAAHRCLADSSLCGQFARQTTRICPQLFPRVFLTIRLVRTVLFLPWSGRLDIWPVSLNFLVTFQTVSRLILSSFATVELLSPFFMEAFDCFSV